MYQNKTSQVDSQCGFVVKKSVFIDFESGTYIIFTFNLNLNVLQHRYAILKIKSNIFRLKSKKSNIKSFAINGNEGQD